MQEYPEYVNKNLTEELFHFHKYVRQTHKPFKNSTLSPTDLYQIIFKENIQVAFPDVESILPLFLSLIVTNCTGESCLGYETLSHFLVIVQLKDAKSISSIDDPVLLEVFFLELSRYETLSHFLVIVQLKDAKSISSIDDPVFAGGLFLGVVSAMRRCHISWSSMRRCHMIFFGNCQLKDAKSISSIDDPVLLEVFFSWSCLAMRRCHIFGNRPAEGCKVHFFN
ncbi:hypothetical protein CDAR_28161 [Caerostris darwini]|uniref:Uncharacterized protein n=1 Tax=Caerostris darwini TaxID=1538125 RepID=A0AAV4VDC1_9ARAC|nr:hypothetical protein CDAR_28161 [Caerostris darwini]